VPVRGSSAPPLEWLLGSGGAAIRFLTRRDLLGEQVDSEDVLADPIVRALLAGPQPDGGFGGHPYRKWTGAHWRLVSLVELGIPAGHPAAVAAAQRVLAWLTGPTHRNAVGAVDGLVRRCASQEGNALAACCRLGLADDERVRLLAHSLMEWQWPDGGWNCDQRATRRSSFHESLPPMWGLHEYAAATGDPDARKAADRTAELLLEHRLFRAMGSGEVINRSWVTLHYPPYWHYDVLQALLILSRLGRADDERAGDAFDLLRQRRLPGGRWRPGGYWWRAPDGSTGPPEVVDWGRGGPNQMITLNALRVLHTAGRT
jgi:hypothetical protein